MAQRYAKIRVDNNVVTNVIQLDNAGQMADPDFYAIQSDTLNISDVYNAATDVRRYAECRRI